MNPVNADNRFGYVVARAKPEFTDSVVAVPGQLPATTAAQPVLAVTRGEKTIARARAGVALTRSQVGEPPPPLPPKVVWQQTRLQAPAELEVSRSRTDLLSERVARG